MGNRANETSIDCGSDPVGSLKKMFVDLTTGPRLDRGQNPAKRPVFLKPHGVAHAQFIVRADVPAELKFGIFAEARAYPAWLRISSDTVPMLPDLNTTVGIGIKLFDVTGEKLAGNPHDRTHDIVLQNHDVFFVDTAADMCAFTRAAFDGTIDDYLRDHPVTDRILKEMAKLVPSALGITYWSCLPYALAAGRAVKYKLEPLVPIGPELGTRTSDPGYLAVDMRNRLRAGEVRFRFMVQQQTTDAKMPLDAATVRWEEAESAPVEVAQLVLPAQDIEARGQREYGENIAINPWRVGAIHRPLGSISDARKVVYAASAELRRNVNGLPDGEPLHPRPTDTYPPATDTVVVSAKIHPSIGIARVGNSQAFFIGPEVAEPDPSVPGTRRDAAGALKRQAARFRVYGYNAAGQAVAELTTDNALVEWQVELANLKAFWYQFHIALDIPEAAKEKAAVRRNAASPDRPKFAIQGGPRSVIGPDRQGADLVFDSGKFLDQQVYLGELRSDEKGRLIVLGEFGKTGHAPGANLTDFANNDGWHDDVSDGPVTAKVTIGGREIPVDPSWIVVAPPNYAPDLKSVRTLYDLIEEVFTDAGAILPPQQVSFMSDILPILKRLSGLQWVNAGYAAAFGHAGTFDFQDPKLLARLADRSEPNKALRYQIANAFRAPTKDGWSPVPWPWLYGDAIELPFSQSPRQNSFLSKPQLLRLKRWAEGSFVSDYAADAKPPRTIRELPIRLQPAMLDRAALEFCLADAFHPGCEMTWPMRHASMYMAPFRIRHRRSDERLYPIGAVLTPDKALAFDGILYGQRAGWLTRWMAVPWHTDTASCLSQAEYDSSYDPYVPTFWPARVPNQVLSEAAYNRVTDTTADQSERVAAFRDRGNWFAATLPSGVDQIVSMLDHYGKLGLIEARKGLEGNSEIPSIIYASDATKAPSPPVDAGPALVSETPQDGRSAADFKARLGNFPFGEHSSS